MDEPAEDAEADTDASDVGDYEHYCIAVAFEFVHGFGFSGLKKKNSALASRTPRLILFGHSVLMAKRFKENLLNGVVHFLTILINEQTHESNNRLFVF